jgi:transposase
MIREVRMVRRKASDPKTEALRASGSLNPHPEQVSDESFARSEFLDARDLVQVKYEMVRRAKLEGWPVSATAAAFGLSRPTFYAAQDALERGGLPALAPAKPGPRGGHKLTDEVLDYLQTVLDADPDIEPTALAGVVADRFGVIVHPRSISRALARRHAKKVQ